MGNAQGPSIAEFARLRPARRRQSAERAFAFFLRTFFFRAIAANVGKNGAPDALADVCVDFEEASGIKNNG